jgi:hypothetical protein
VGRRRQPDEKEARRRITKPGDGFSPIVVFGKPFHFFTRDPFSPADKAGTLTASDDAGLTVGKGM